MATEHLRPVTITLSDVFRFVIHLAQCDRLDIWSADEFADMSGPVSDEEIAAFVDDSSYAGIFDADEHAERRRILAEWRDRWATPGRLCGRGEGEGQYAEIEED